VTRKGTQSMTRKNNRKSNNEDIELEEIHLLLNDAFSYQSGAKMRMKICKTMKRLPQAVREYVYNNCMFFEVDQNTIAHEIAHTFQNHKKEGKWTLIDSDEVLEQEAEACELAKRWGFSGPGAELEK
jgi:hypothetical protein